MYIDMYIDIHADIQFHGINGKITLMIWRISVNKTNKIENIWEAKTLYWS